MKPSIPKGTRDFLPAEVIRRKYLFDVIERVFQKYAYVPIETPALENLSTLTGKYGDEGDKLLFKVLNNGDFLAKADQDALQAGDSQRLAPSIARRGMRYDLTVPFARYVVQHQNEIQLPFKRYQIQPVWRADRPQKGRYQEFYQCDVDVVGSTSLMYEAELVHILDEVFDALNIKVTIRLNNRKVLAGFAEVAGIADRFVDMTVAIDKLDKIGEDGVTSEMQRRGIAEAPVQRVLELLKMSELSELEQSLGASETGSLGITELKTIFQYLDGARLKNSVKFDPTLARGLSYYTGCIFEVQANEYEIGSISGGGRYDDLTGLFGLKGVSGVGISFGAARIYDVMTALDLFPKDLYTAPRILFVAFDSESHHYAFNCVMKCRQSGINADLYPDPTKIKKQMRYANALGVPFVALVGDTERQANQVTLKDMVSGEQSQLSLEDALARIH